MEQKAKDIISVLIILAVISGVLYWLVIKSERDLKNKVEAINKKYEYSRGVISDYKSYKGHSIDVKYLINGKFYESSGKWDINPKGLGKGDSINFRYSVDNPKLILTELDKEY